MPPRDSFASRRQRWQALAAQGVAGGAAQAALHPGETTPGTATMAVERDRPRRVGRAYSSREATLLGFSPQRTPRVQRRDNNGTADSVHHLSLASEEGRATVPSADSERATGHEPRDTGDHHHGETETPSRPPAATKITIAERNEKRRKRETQGRRPTS